MKDLRPGARAARGATCMFVQGFVFIIIGVAYFVILVNPRKPQRMGKGA